MTIHLLTSSKMLLILLSGACNQALPVHSKSVLVGAPQSQAGTLCAIELLGTLSLIFWAQ
jgi:hypothetical protein